MAKIRLPSSLRSSWLPTAPAKERKRSCVSNQLCPELGSETTSSAARDSSPLCGEHPPLCVGSLGASEDPQAQSRALTVIILALLRKPKHFLLRELEWRTLPHKEAPLQRGETRLSLARSDCMKTACAFRGQHGTYRGTTTNETIRHVAGHGTGPSIQARLLGTHIDEGLTVTTSKQKMKRSFRRQK